MTDEEKFSPLPVTPLTSEEIAELNAPETRKYGPTLTLVQRLLAIAEDHARLAEAEERGWWPNACRQAWAERDALRAQLEWLVADYRERRAIRLQIRMDYSPKQRRDRDVDCALARAAEVALGGPDRPAWCESRYQQPLGLHGRITGGRIER